MNSALKSQIWYSWFRGGRRRTRPAQPTQLRVEPLEDRLTPSTVDLTSVGSIGSINGGIFRQYSPQPTGTGVIDSFVRIQSIKGGVEQGYNSDSRPVQFNENTSPQFTRSLPLSEIPVVDIGGVEYCEFLLDINQKASQPLLSLDELRLYGANAGNLTGYNTTTNTLAGLSPVYDMDAGGDNWIELDSRQSHGSGSGDMLAYIPASDFAGSSYVYLYSKFGVNLAPNGGFEEWAAGKSAITQSTGSISGTVTDASSGLPLGDTLVFLDANQNGQLDSNEIFTYTDANGNYQFNLLATGLGAYSTYDVTIVAPSGYEYALAGTQVALQTSGQTATNIDFALTPTNTGAGRGGGT